MDLIHFLEEAGKICDSNCLCCCECPLKEYCKIDFSTLACNADAVAQIIKAYQEDNQNETNN